MRLIDSHCHLDLPAFSEDREAMLQAAKKRYVSDIVIPAVTAESWAALKVLCQRDNPVNLHGAYGLHPMFMGSHKPTDLDALDTCLASYPAVAVGECGLDFFIKDYDQNSQLEYFTAQLDLAVQYRLPVIIHSRKSLDLVLKEIRLRPGLTGVVHSFSGSEQQARQLIDLGFYLSFGGPVTYERAKKLRHLVKVLPLTNLLLETDAPDQPDASHHGLRNQPAWLLDVAMVFAELKDMDVDAIAEATTRNCCELFCIEKAL